MAVSAKLGELFVQFVANTGGFDRDVEKSRGLLGLFSDTLGSTAGMLRAWLVTKAAAAAISPIVSSAQELKSLKLESELLGISANALGAYRYAASQVNIDNRQLVQSMSQLGEKIADLRTGAGESVELFKMLGVEAKAFDGLRVDESFELVGEALSKLGKLEQLKVGSNLLEDEGIALLNFFPILQHAKKEFRALGGEVSEQQLNDVSALDKEYRKFTATLGMIAKTITVDLAPSFVLVGKAMVEISQGVVAITNAFGDEWKQLVESLEPFMPYIGAGMNLVTTGSTTGVAPQVSLRGALKESIVRGSHERLGVLDGGTQNVEALLEREAAILERMERNSQRPQRTAGF